MFAPKVTSARVPMEFVGLARQFYREIEAAHRATAPVRRRLIDGLEALAPRRGFRAPPRRETLRGIAADWRALPTGALLGLKLDLAGDRLRLADLRAAPGRMHMEGWQEDSCRWSWC